jgi:hypothetical protein
MKTFRLDPGTDGHFVAAYMELDGQIAEPLAAMLQVLKERAETGREPDLTALRAHLQNAWSALTYSRNVMRLYVERHGPRLFSEAQAAMRADMGKLVDLEAEKAKRTAMRPMCRCTTDDVTQEPPQEPSPQAGSIPAETTHKGETPMDS